MPFVKNYGEAKPVEGSVCVYLRSKAIYVTGELKQPDHPDEEGSHHAWCNKTQHVKGPDREDCTPSRCVAGRECYRDCYES